MVVFVLLRRIQIRVELHNFSEMDWHYGGIDRGRIKMARSDGSSISKVLIVWSFIRSRLSW